jgi:hypothetical protein
MNLRQVMSRTSIDDVRSIEKKYNCSVSVQIREASKLGNKVRQELCNLHGIPAIAGWGINKNGWKHSKRRSFQQVNKCK